jgi:hypothetical protein
MASSVFAKYIPVVYPYTYRMTILVRTLVGGIPTNEQVAEAWLKTKLADKDDLIREAVAETMAERGITADDAAKIVDDARHLNGFKRDDEGLYIEGRQLKAMLKEASSVAANAGNLTAKKWGNPDDANYRKGIKGWFPEHIHVLEDRVHLGVKEPTGILQRFVHTRFGAGIQYEEYVSEAELHFTVTTDYNFTEEQWAALWLTTEKQGIGASRSQGYGAFTVTGWERLK